jgi:hypothetical protein
MKTPVARRAGHGFALLLGELVELRLQLRMDRALAAIHHDGDVEQVAVVDRVEDDVVVVVERVAPGPAGTEIRVPVVADRSLYSTSFRHWTG